MIPAGQHRSKTNPKTMNCFFCFRDRFCEIVQLPDETIADLREKAKDDLLMQAVINRLSKTQFVCCGECLNNKEWVHNGIAHWIKTQHLTEQMRGKK